MMKPEDKDKNESASPENKKSQGAPENTQGLEGEIIISKAEYADLSKAKEEKTQLYDKWLRLQAEFENYKKRVIKEREELIQYANGELICELLEIVDNLERAVESAEKKHNDKLLHQGVGLILKDMQEFLRKQDVCKIKCLDEKFDPHKHEAVMQVETDEKPEDTVVEEVRPGYMVGQKVIRPAMVKVAKKKEVKNG